MFFLASQLKELYTIRLVRFSSRAETLFNRRMVHGPQLGQSLFLWIFPIARRTASRYAIGFANLYGARIILLRATYLGYIYSHRPYCRREHHDEAGQ
jgi:hypothetical protein